MRLYLLADLAFGLVVVLVSLAVTRRARRSRTRRDATSLEGFVRTDEVFYDPTTGAKHEVWFNPRTGKRRYRPVDGGEDG